MISLIHLLSIKARPLPPLSQEQGGIDTETVATTRFAALLQFTQRSTGKSIGDSLVLLKNSKIRLGDNVPCAVFGDPNNAQ
jgi:hypothetical protein